MGPRRTSARLHNHRNENTILIIQNKVLMTENLTPEAIFQPTHASRAVERTLARQRAAYESEVRRLVEATLLLIERTGHLEPTVSAILRESGLSNQAFYKHFRSKDEFFVAVLDEGMRILASYLDHRMRAESEPTARVRAWIAGLLEQALNPEAAAATRPFTLSRDQLATRFPDEVAESERQLTGLVAAAIREGQDAGDLATTTPEQDAESLYHLAMGWIQARLRESELPDREDADRLIEFALAGLLRPATARS
jgi:AcrR family transcriptional regulator